MSKRLFNPSWLACRHINDQLLLAIMTKKKK